MILEALVNLEEKKGSKSYKIGNLVTIQLSGHPWGTGDLKNKLMVQITFPSLPCVGTSFEFKCNLCEYQGIYWFDKHPKNGSKGKPKTTCDKERITVSDCIYTFKINKKGIPTIEQDVRLKRIYTLKTAIFKDTDLYPVYSHILKTYSKKPVLTEKDRDTILNDIRNSKEILPLNHFRLINGPSK
jgi:hypothetical protein